jgi:hypothetical protein
MSRIQVLFALLLTAVLALAITIGSSALGARHGHGTVVCKFSKRGGKRVVVCPKGLRGRRGPRGRRGVAGAPGPAGTPAGAGSGLNLNFADRLTANKTKELTIGNFTITAATNGSGKCLPILLRPGTTTPKSQLAVGPGVAFKEVASGESPPLTSGSNSNMFTAVSDDGSKTMSGIVGSIGVGNVCVISGYVTGD